METLSLLTLSVSIESWKVSCYMLTANTRLDNFMKTIKKMMSQHLQRWAMFGSNIQDVTTFAKMGNVWEQHDILWLKWCNISHFKAIHFFITNHRRNEMHHGNPVMDEATLRVVPLSEVTKQSLLASPYLLMMDSLHVLQYHSLLWCVLFTNDLRESHFFTSSMGEPAPRQEPQSEEFNGSCPRDHSLYSGVPNKRL